MPISFICSVYKAIRLIQMSSLKESCKYHFWEPKGIINVGWQILDLRTDAIEVVYRWYEKVAKEELVLDVFQLTTIYVLCNYEWIVEIFLVKITLWYVSSWTKRTKRQSNTFG